MADNTIRLTINGKHHELDPDDLTLGEVELLEEELDQPLEDIDFSRAKAMRVLVYLMVRRSEPQFTLEDAGELKVASIQDASEKKPAAGKRPTRAAQSG